MIAIVTLPRILRRVVVRTVQANPADGVRHEPSPGTRHRHGSGIRRAVSSGSLIVLLGAGTAPTRSSEPAARPMMVSQTLVAIEKIGVGLWRQRQIPPCPRHPHEHFRGDHIRRQAPPRVRWRLASHYASTSLQRARSCRTCARPPMAQAIRSESSGTWRLTPSA